MDLGPARHGGLRWRPADVLVRCRIPGSHREGDPRTAHRISPRVLRAGIDVPGHRGGRHHVRGRGDGLPLRYSPRDAQAAEQSEVGPWRALHRQRAPGHRGGGAAGAYGVRRAGHAGERSAAHCAVGHDPCPRRRHVIAVVPDRPRTQRALLQHLLASRGLRRHRPLRDRDSDAPEGRRQGDEPFVQGVPQDRCEARRRG